MNPQSENIDPASLSSKDHPVDFSPTTKSNLSIKSEADLAQAPDIDLDFLIDEDESPSIVKEPLLEPILDSNFEPNLDTDIDVDPYLETTRHHGMQPVDVEYPTPEPEIDTVPPVAPIPAKTSPTKDRIHSVDALRGFDMFWIVGGTGILAHLSKLYDWPWLTWANTQLHHTEWAGFTFFDLIFPLFLFLAGVSMPISLGKRLANGSSKTSLFAKVTFRAIILILLGIIYNGGLDLKPLEETRLCSVLGFIGISYFIAGIIFIFSDVKHRIIWATGLLSGYYAALMFINVPEHGAGVLTPEGVFTGYIDRTWAAWKLLTPNFDPEGLFLPISGAVIAITGSLTGSFLVRCSWNKFIKAILLGAAGVGFYYASIFLEPHMIMCKNFWSPTFVLHCLGWSIMLLAAFYLIMDAIGFWHWAIFFIVIGMNSITIYMGLKLFNFTETSNKLFAGTIDKFFKVESQPLITSIAFILTWWVILFVMYRKKVFLRI